MTGPAEGGPAEGAPAEGAPAEGAPAEGRLPGAVTGDDGADPGGLPPAFYLPRGDDRYEATEATTSPWDPRAQHGGPPTALLAACMDDAMGRTDLRLARISVDFLGPMPRTEVRVAVEVVRPGRRTQLTEAVLWAGERRVAVARAWYLAVAPDAVAPDAGAVGGTAVGGTAVGGTAVGGTAVGGTAGGGAGMPPRPGPQPQAYFEGDTAWGYGRATEWRTVSGGYRGATGAAEVWTRVRIPLVEGRPMDGLARLLVVADSANGLSAPYPMVDWWFIPPGVTMHVQRIPVGDWVLLSARSDPGVDGIGLTEGTLSDAAGRCGTVTQALLVARR